MAASGALPSRDDYFSEATSEPVLRPSNTGSTMRLQTHAPDNDRRLTGDAVLLAIVVGVALQLLVGPIAGIVGAVAGAAVVTLPRITSHHR